MQNQNPSSTSQMIQVNCPKCGAANLMPVGVACNCGVCQAPMIWSGPSSPAQQTSVKPYPNLSDKWVWALACVPIISNLLVGFILGFMVGARANVDETMATIISVGVPLLFNCLFVFEDVKELKRNGQEANNWIVLGILLIPVYLFLRASKTNKQYGYAILWCCLFVVSLFV